MALAEMAADVRGFPCMVAQRDTARRMPGPYPGSPSAEDEK
jgi:hypothetical protein